MPLTKLTDLSEDQIRSLCHDWNKDGTYPRVSYERDLEDTTVRAPEFHKYLEVLKSDQWPDYERWEEVPGGHYGHTDAAVWKAIKNVSNGGRIYNSGPRRGMVTADIGCIRGLYASMLLVAGSTDITIFEPNGGTSDILQIKIVGKDLTQSTEGYTSQFDLITCISTVEHVGLGRYGDPIDGQGDIKLMDAIHTILKPGGYAIVSFPFDERKDSRGQIVWNLHRVYNNYRKSLLFKGFEIVDEEDIGRFQPTWTLRSI